jgi:hypothetical protein
MFHEPDFRIVGIDDDFDDRAVDFVRQQFAANSMITEPPESTDLRVGRVVEPISRIKADTRPVVVKFDRPDFVGRCWHARSVARLPHSASTYIFRLLLGGFFEG